MTETEEDAYLTLRSDTYTELKVKGSRFIGRAIPVNDRDQAEKQIRQISQKYHDATHNCFAYQIGTGDAVYNRFNDDGEPSGTAGKPILEAIQGRRLTCVLCVVTRYFGGTKLGTGGLARAYSDCAVLALDGAEIVKHFLTTPLQITFPYDMTGTVMHLISDYHVKIVHKEYGPKTNLTLHVRRSQADAFEKDIINATAGKAQTAREHANHG